MTTSPVGFRTSQGPTPEWREQFRAKSVADLGTGSGPAPGAGVQDLG